MEADDKRVKSKKALGIFESLDMRANNARIRDINARAVSISANFHAKMGISLGQIRIKDKKNLINTDILTSVPRRGKMVDTQKYIRDNLQSYADNKYFAFTKQPKEISTKRRN
jgi:hypothetical protein